jgi:hypothetical protein
VISTNNQVGSSNTQCSLIFAKWTKTKFRQVMFWCPC